MDDEELSIERARSLLLDEKNEQVKVTRQRAMKSGFTTEKVVFEQARPPKGKKEIGLSASINAAPPCASLEDLFALDARVVMGRIFREFLDKLVITPSELLHNYGYIKKLDATGNLISGAVFQIGQAQANAGLGSVKDLVDALHRLVDEAKMLARDTLAERKRLPLLEDGQFGLLCRRAEARFEPAERGYMIMTALTNYLAGMQSWGAEVREARQAVRRRRRRRRHRPARRRHRRRARIQRDGAGPARLAGQSGQRPRPAGRPGAGPPEGAAGAGLGQASSC